MNKKSLDTSIGLDKKIRHIRKIVAKALQKFLTDNDKAQLIIEAGNKLSEKIRLDLHWILQGDPPIFRIINWWSWGKTSLGMGSTLYTSPVEPLFMNSRIMSVSKMIKLARFDAVDSRITSKTFPVKSQGQRQFSLIAGKFTGQYDEDKTLSLRRGQEILDEKMGLGFRYARIEELLALYLRIRGLYWYRFPVFAAGSIITDPDGQRWIPCIYRADNNKIHFRLLPIWHQEGAGNESEEIGVYRYCSYLLSNDDENPIERDVLIQYQKPFDRIV